MPRLFVKLVKVKGGVRLKDFDCRIGMPREGHDENSDLSDFSDFVRSGPRSDFSSFAL